METLDGKYFESTIATLKKARLNEKIAISPAFKAQLKAGILEKAAKMALPPRPDWAEWVLKYKYVFGGVPVLAILAIVAINALNFQVKVPRTDIVPETITNTEANQDVGSVTAGTDNQTAGEPAIKTFPADLVMPPDYILEQRALENSTGAVSEPAESSVASGLMFLEGQSGQVKLSVPALKKTTSSQTIATTQATNPATAATSAPGSNGENSAPTSTENTTVPEQKTVIMESQSRPEVSGRVEQNGTATPAPLVEVTTETVDNSVTAPSTATTSPNQVMVPQTATQAPTDQSTTTTTTVTTTTNADGTTTTTTTVPVTRSLTENPTTTPASSALPVTEQAPAVTAPVSVTPVVLPEVRVESTDYINPVQEMNQPVEKSGLELTTAVDLVSPQFLTAGRIIYTGRNRTQVVAAVETAFAARNGTLSSDYYISVQKLENNSYKATLFENGKVKEVTVLAVRDGKLVVVTEVGY